MIRKGNVTMTKSTRIEHGADGYEVLIEVATRECRTRILRMAPEDLEVWKGLKDKKFDEQSRFGHWLVFHGEAACILWLMLFGLVMFFVGVLNTWIAPEWERTTTLTILLVVVLTIPVLLLYSSHSRNKRDCLRKRTRDELLKKNGHEGVDSDYVAPGCFGRYDPRYVLYPKKEE